MPIYVVTCSYPDVEGWADQQAAHLDWLAEQVEQGVLVAAGPLAGAVPAGLLVVAAADKQQVRVWLATDPFALANNLTDIDVTAWDPLFGGLQRWSSVPDSSYPQLRALLLDRALRRARGTLPDPPTGTS